MKKVYRIQQILVTTSILLCNIADGFIFGQMSGMLDALRTDKTTLQLDDNDLSWIASTINITCFCGFALIGTITRYFGRKKATILAIIPMLISWVLTYLAMDKTTLLVSRFLAGISYGCTLFLTYINIGEYMPPDMRFQAYSLLACVGSLVGTMSGHVLSVLLHWRTVALIGLVPSLLSMGLSCFWVESPMWLAEKGRFKECAESFRAIRKPGPDAEENLKLLISFKKEKREKQEKKKTTISDTLRKYRNGVKELRFWKVMVLSTVENTYKVAAGRILFNTLAISMLQDITGTSNILYFTLITNSFSILGASCSCILLRSFKIRQILFSTGLLANFILISLGLVLYFAPEKSTYLNWIKISLLSLYLVTAGIGPYPVIDSSLTEIYPLDLKEFMIIILGVIIGIIQFLAIKLAPSMFREIGYHGVFFLNASIVFMCMTYLWFFLPETKGKTLQEIEVYFETGVFATVSEKEQSKELIDVKHNNDSDII